MNKPVDLSRFSNSWYQSGNPIIRTLWYLTSALFFMTYVPYPNRIKAVLLRVFGAKIGSRVVIKPRVCVKYPWRLEIGDSVWIGEDVWIDNLDRVRIGANACLSQGALILTGNHDYTKTTFDLMIKPVTIEDGAWVGARAVLCPGVTLRSHSVIMAGSVVSKDTEPYTVYRGNPADAVRERKIE